MYLLIPLSVILVFVAIWIFFSMADGGQFDDLVGPAWRIVHDDDRPEVHANGEQTGNQRAAPPARPESGETVPPSTNPTDFDSHQGT